MEPPRSAARGWLACALAAILAAGGCSRGDEGQTAAPSAPDRPVPVERGGKVPDAELVNQDGRAFRLSDLRGQVVVLTFLYTRCNVPSMCPLAAAKLAEAHRRLRERSVEAVRILAISFDFERDAPGELKRFAALYEADLSGFWFATGTPQEVGPLARGFHTYYRKAGEGVFEHNIVVSIIDREGVLRDDFFGTEWDVEELVTAVAGLAMPAPSATAPGASSTDLRSNSEEEAMTLLAVAPLLAAALAAQCDEDETVRTGADPAAQEEPPRGTIVGRVESRWTARFPVLVYVERAEGEFRPPEEHPVMDQREKAFAPRLLPVVVGTTVDFVNSDPFEHNVNSPDGERYDLGNWPQGERRSYAFRRAGVYTQLCTLHPEMIGYVAVLQNPFFAVTNAEGAFRIENVPAGTYRLKIWCERFRPNQMEPATEVTVTAGQETAPLTIRP